MSQIVPGGDPAALVTGLVIQEVDVNGNVYFQWRSWDHFEITDATWDIDLTSHWIDYVHANAIDFDSDGNILVSCRHLDEVTKIDFTTGEIIWRFGKNAENNQFDFVNDPLGFSHQHDIRKLANGNYTVYDNGNLHAPPFSRAVEYHLDEETMEATLVWQYEHDPSIYAPLTGGNQKLPNNNRLIGWGGTSPIALTEVNDANQVVFELYLPDSITGYRARKYNWETTVFSAQPEIDFGNFEGFQTPKRYLLQVTNNYQQPIQITSTYNHTSEFFTSTLLPASIPPGGTVDLLVQFQPGNTGNFQDVLTLNYDNPGNTERIARQITLKGLWDASLLSAIFVPESGAQNVDPDGLITVTFNEPARKIFHQEMEDSDVPYLFNFRLTNVYGEDVPFHGTVSEDKTIITLFPDETLNEFQQYFIELKPNMLEDYQGNVMNYPEFCFFTTGEQVKIISPEIKKDIVFYPNPVNGILKVASSGDPIERIEIYTPDGRLLWEAGINSCEAEVNTDSFPKGLLVVMIREQGGNWLPLRVVKL
jgi:hypothetical protein